MTDKQKVTVGLVHSYRMEIRDNTAYLSDFRAVEVTTTETPIEDGYVVQIKRRLLDGPARAGEEG